MSTPGTTRPVTVGVDANEERTTAGVLHGAALARSIGAPLRLLYASPLPFEGIGFTAYEVQVARDEANSVLDRAADVARRLAPDVPATIEPVLGSPTLALERASKDSSAVVVVRRGASLPERILSGSTSSRIATHASCPVVVVPFGARIPTTGPVVVAIDADSPAHGALTFAFETARRAGADLVVLHAVSRRTSEQGRRGLGETLAGWREDYPDVEVIPRTVEASTVDACAEAARGARFLILGRHRTSGTRLPWVRSIAKAVLARTTCPVITVPHDSVDLAYRPPIRPLAAPSRPVY